MRKEGAVLLLRTWLLRISVVLPEMRNAVPLEGRARGGGDAVRWPRGRDGRGEGGSEMEVW